MFPNFDPSKMDPKVLMELSRMVQQLPPAQLQHMQTLMHNKMAGFDVTRELEEFEKSLPPGFREKLMSVMISQGGSSSVPVALETQGTDSQEMDLRQARLTLLRAVAAGEMSPEDAERVLFPS